MVENPWRERSIGDVYKRQSLKGPKHGGANIKVVEMMRDIEAHVSDWTDEDAVRAYLNKILNKEAFDGKGLIYGMGHAVYSLSDPRAQVFKSFVEKLAVAKGRDKDFALYSMIERMAPEVISQKSRIYKLSLIHILRQLKSFVAAASPLWIASKLQAPMQRPQPRHFS